MQWQVAIVNFGDALPSVEMYEIRMQVVTEDAFIMPCVNGCVSRLPTCDQVTHDAC